MKEKLTLHINREKWEALKTLRGWRYPISTLAKRTGFTKSYISQVINGGIEVSIDFMLAMIQTSGASTRETEECFGLFEIIKNPIGEKPGGENYQKDNYAKFNGSKPYVEFSDIGRMRKEDKAKDLERLKMPNPIPAMDYYDDATPKRIQYQCRFKK